MPASAAPPVAKAAKPYSLSAAAAVIRAALPDWQPWPAIDTPPGQIRIGDRLFTSLPLAAKALSDNDQLDIGAGVYRQPLFISANGVTVRGHGHVIIERTSTRGKGAIVTKGNDIRIENIECRQIQVSDRNGACVRHEGRDLKLEHVYFHHAEQGLLTGPRPGHVRIFDSRFAQLGRGGRAHGIYVGGGRLDIDRSQFLSSKEEGHEIKSRALETHISRSVIASLSGKDSRLIDLSQGGILTITDSVLEQGPMSANNNAIGIGLERKPHAEQQATLTGNIIILERRGRNRLFQLGKGIPRPILSRNFLVSEEQQGVAGDNLWLKDRQALKLGPYPELPPVPQR